MDRDQSRTPREAVAASQALVPGLQEPTGGERRIHLGGDTMEAFTWGGPNGFRATYVDQWNQTLEYALRQWSLCATPLQEEPTVPFGPIAARARDEARAREGVRPAPLGRVERATTRDVRK